MHRFDMEPYAVPFGEAILKKDQRRCRASSRRAGAGRVWPMLNVSVNLQGRWCGRFPADGMFKSRGYSQGPTLGSLMRIQPRRSQRSIGELLLKIERSRLALVHRAYACEMAPVCPSQDHASEI